MKKEMITKSGQYSKYKFNRGKENGCSKIFSVPLVIMLLLLLPFVSITLSSDQEISRSHPVPSSQQDENEDESTPDLEVNEGKATERVESSPPGTRAAGERENLTFFLHKVIDTEPAKTIPLSDSTWNWFDTEADFNSNRTQLNSTGTQNVFNWYLWPVLASDMTADDLTLKIWAQAAGTKNVNANIDVVVYERDSTGTETKVNNMGGGSLDFEKTAELKTWQVNFPSTHTFKKGSSIKVSLEANPGSSVVHFYYDSPAANSRVDINTTDHMEIESISSLNWEEVVKQSFGQLVDNKTLYIRTTVFDPFGGYDINFVRLTLIGPNENLILDNVSMINITDTAFENRTIYSYTWNYSTFSEGRYNITIWAVDNNGYNYYHHFNHSKYGIYPDKKESYFYLGALPKHVWIKTVDDQKNIMVNAVVYAYIGVNPITYNATNSQGLTNITAYPGDYNLIVKWQDIDVALEPYKVTVNVSELDPVVINCSVFYPTFTTIDNASNILSDANVYIVHPNQTHLEPARTDQDGNINLDQIPNGNYDVIVRWRGIDVNASIILINSSGVYMIICSVYYVTFRTVDYNYNSIENIGVTVFDNKTAWVLDFKISNMTGIAITKVPSGTVDIKAYWQNIVVNTSYLVTITGDAFITIVCSIFDVPVKVVDSRGLPVEDAQVISRKRAGGDILDSGITNADGEVNLHLIAGNYYFEVYWRTVLVNAKDIKISDMSQQVIQAAIYYINFNFVDSKNNVVSDAQLYIYSSSSGTLIESQRTNISGFNEIRLPTGFIDIEVYWKTILVNSTDNIPISSDVDPFVVNLWVYYLTCKVVDSKNVPVTNAQTMVYINATKELVDSGTTDESGIVVLRLPKCGVDITVIWESKTVYYEANYSVSANIDKELMAWVYYVTFEAVDSKDIGVTGSQIELKESSDGETLYTQTTNSEGSAVFRLPLGTYYLEAYWQGILVSTISDLTVNSNIEPYPLVLWIYYINFIAKDSQHHVVANALIKITSDETGEVLDSQITTTAGTIESRLPKGSVSVNVVWKDVEVKSIQVEITTDIPAATPFELMCDIYYLTITALDSKDIPIAEAQVSIKRGTEETIMDSLTTSATGGTISRLPIGQYSIYVRWYDIEVYSESNVNIVSDLSKVLDCSVFYITVHAKDDGGYALENARIILTHIEANKVIFTNVTDEFGEIEARLPIGAYTTEIYWQDVLVSSGSYYFNVNDDIYITCDVFYLTLVLEDSKSQLLADAQILLTLTTHKKFQVSNTTELNGSIVERIPIGEYDIYVYWEGVLVKSKYDYSVKTSHILTLKCDVFYLNLVAQDIDNIPLESAHVYLNFYRNNKVYDSIVTESSGEVESRIPIGSYNISVYWKEVLVYSEIEYHINVSENRNLNCNVFYLTVKAIGNDNEPIPDVSIKIIASEADIEESQHTNNKGEVEFRLPFETYEVSGHLQTTHLLKKIDQKKKTDISLTDRSETVKLKFSDYPPSFFSTPAFSGITLPILIFIIILFLIWWFVIRKQKKRLDKKAEAEVDRPYMPMPSSSPYKKVLDEEKPETLDDDKPDEIKDEPEETTEDNSSNNDVKEE